MDYCNEQQNLIGSSFVPFLAHDRTDRGVHAICSSAHVDLERAGGLNYEPAHLTAGYNKYFTKAKLDIRYEHFLLMQSHMYNLLK
jgi:tRNA U38,U39,U40 pseudouridine synthase TruA